VAQPIRQIAVIGAGLMGHAIAQACAQAGVRVCLTDVDGRVLDAALTRIDQNLSGLVRNGFFAARQASAARGRVKAVKGLSAALDGAELVQEAIPEDPALKKRLFAQLDTLCPDDGVILATNTSSIRISEIAAATRSPRRVVGIHWVSPAYLVPVIEVVRGKATSEAVLRRAAQYVRRLGKVPVVCRDIPGFVINRVQMALLNEAMELVEKGIASAEDVDNAIRLAVGSRLALFGPLKLNDLFVTKRTTLATMRYIHAKTGHPKFRPPRLLKRMVATGQDGVFSGQGFFGYGRTPRQRILRERDRALVLMTTALRQLARKGVPGA
jgi:3-hydroxybutyryl-CoA dehydrogenase